MAEDTQLSADELLADSEREEAQDFERRKIMARKIGQYALNLALHHHKLSTGDSLDLDRKFVFQREIYSSDAMDLVIQGSTGQGKSHGLDTPILMYDGSIKMVQDVVVGDQLMGPDSGPRMVLALGRGQEEMYRIVPVKGEPYVVNKPHILSLKMTKQGLNRHGKPRLGQYEAGKIINISVEDYLKKSNHWRHCAKGYRVGVEFRSQEVPIEPYYLGLWLGDGTQAKPDITSADPEVEEYLKGFANRIGMNLSIKPKVYTHAKLYSLIRKDTEHNEMLKTLRRLGLTERKHVPHAYKANDRRTRMEVLAGLIDSDGNLSFNSYDLVFISKAIADDTAYLARSLGLAAYVRPCKKMCCNNGKVGDYFRVIICGDTDEIPLRIARKKAKPRQQKKDVLVTGIKVEPLGRGDYYGFMLDGDGLYLLGDFTVTHNTEILIVRALAAAALGLRVMQLAEKARKAIDLVIGRMDPMLHSLPLYKGLLKAAKDERAAEADSSRMKHFGDGEILFTSLQAETEVYSYRADLTQIDEYQLAPQSNVRRLFGRRTGSPWRFQVACGNPKTSGRTDPQSLHGLFLNSDAREWNVKCPHCQTFQVMGWWSHYISEVRNEHGAILTVEIRDKERSAEEDKDIRPICTTCQKPMRRIDPDGKWVPQFPGRRRVGYHLSNLYNPLVGTRELLDEYRKGLHDPQAMAEFVNDQLGLPYDHSGTAITQEMLDNAASGQTAGVPPYRLFPAHQLKWRSLAS